MQFRKVPKNGDQLSILGYGCMRLPLKRGSIDRDLASRQILGAVEQGVNYIDTAVPYHNGKSEPFLGRLFAENGGRDKVKLATKLPHWSAHAKADMDAILDKQLKDLRTDRIDYYLVHNLNGNSWQKAKENGVREFLDDALKKGKIVNAGFSYHGGTEDFKTVVDDYDWTFCQIQYNYLDTQNQAGTAGLKYAAANDLAVMIMEPLRGGNLAKTPPPEVAALWKKLNPGRSPAEWALRWVWNHPEVTVVLSGMNRDRHIRENITMASKALPDAFSDDELNVVDEVQATFRRVMKVGCTGCQYCMPCPKGVNIPACFEYYNSRYTFKDWEGLIHYLANNGGAVSGVPSLASQCVQCNACVEKCPQDLAIPHILEDVAKTMEGFLSRPLLWIIKRVMKVRANGKRHP